MKRYNKLTLEISLEDMKNLIRNTISNNEKITITKAFVKDGVLLIEGVGGTHIDQNIDIPICFNTIESIKSDKLPDTIKQKIVERFEQSDVVDLTDIYEANINFKRNISSFISHSKFYKDFELIGEFKYKRK